MRRALLALALLAAPASAQVVTVPGDPTCQPPNCTPPIPSQVRANSVVTYVWQDFFCGAAPCTIHDWPTRGCEPINPDTASAAAICDACERVGGCTPPADYPTCPVSLPCPECPACPEPPLEADTTCPEAEPCPACPEVPAVHPLFARIAQYAPWPSCSLLDWDGNGVVAAGDLQRALYFQNAITALREEIKAAFNSTCVDGVLVPPPAPEPAP